MTALRLTAAALALGLIFPRPPALQAADGASNGGPELTYEDAADHALGASLALKEAYARGALRAGAWRLGFRSYLPRLSVAAGQDERLSAAGRDDFQKTYSLTLRQQLWDGGLLARSRSREAEDLLREEAALGRLSQEIAESALAAYRGVLASRALVSIRERSCGDLREQARYLEAEAGRGLAKRADVEDALLVLAEQALELEVLRLGLRDAEGSLAELLGLPVLPPLAESIEYGRPSPLPAEEAILSAALGGNPDLAAAGAALRNLHSQGSLAPLLPAVSLQADGSLSGETYPLTRAAWSVGLNLELSSPWLRGTLGAALGWEFPEARTVRFQVQLEPMPDPASSLAQRSARTTLALEEERRRILAARVCRTAISALERCRLGRAKLELAVQRLERGREMARLADLSVRLGRASRLESMRALTGAAALEVALLEAAASLLEAERELERLLGLAPGTLGEFAGPQDGGMEP